MKIGKTILAKQGEFPSSKSPNINPMATRCARFQTSTQSSQSVVDRGRAAYYRIRLMLRRSKHPIDRAFCMDEYKYLFSQIFNSDNTESISREICQLDLHEYVRLYHSENSDAYEDAVIQRIIELEMYLVCFQIG